YPLRTLLAAGTIYGVATLAHGSGFLAVFIAGIMVGDIRAPYKAEIERFHSALASFAEIVAFAMLGLTVSVTHLVHGDAWLVWLSVVPRDGVLLPVGGGTVLRGGDGLLLMIDPQRPHRGLAAFEPPTDTTSP